MRTHRAAPRRRGTAPPLARPTAPGSGGRGHRTRRPSRGWHPHGQIEECRRSRERYAPAAESRTKSESGIAGSTPIPIPDSRLLRHRRRSTAPIRRPHGRILDAELVEVGLELLRVVIERPHLLAVLLENPLVA